MNYVWGLVWLVLSSASLEEVIIAACVAIITAGLVLGNLTPEGRS